MAGISELSMYQATAMKLDHQKTEQVFIYVLYVLCFCACLYAAVVVVVAALLLLLLLLFMFVCSWNPIAKPFTCCSQPVIAQRHSGGKEAGGFEIFQRLIAELTTTCNEF